MKHRKLSVKLDEPNFNMLAKAKKENTEYFNFRLIDHYSKGERVYVYLAGTAGGGHLGIIPKKLTKAIGQNPEVVDFYGDDGGIFLDILIPHTTVKKKKSSGCGLLFAVISIMVAILLFNMDWTTKEDTRTENEKLIEKHFSPLDGSHRELTYVIKDNLNDPDSYEHIETTYRIQGDTIWVFTNFRSKNGFGGMVREGVTAITDKQTGKVIEWMKQ